MSHCEIHEYATKLYIEIAAHVRCYVRNNKSSTKRTFTEKWYKLTVHFANFFEGWNLLKSKWYVERVLMMIIGFQIKSVSIVDTI